MLSDWRLGSTRDGRHAGACCRGLLRARDDHKIEHMQVLIEFDDETIRRLEAVAPGKSRKRSAFIRAAVQKALWELEEEKTRRAYLQSPDVEPVAFDVVSWEPLPFGGFEPPREKGVTRDPSKPSASKRRRAGSRRRPTRRARKS